MPFRKKFASRDALIFKLSRRGSVYNQCLTFFLITASIDFVCADVSYFIMCEPENTLCRHFPVELAKFFLKIKSLKKKKKKKKLANWITGFCQ